MLGFGKMEGNRGPVPKRRYSHGTNEGESGGRLGLVPYLGGERRVEKQRIPFGGLKLYLIQGLLAEFALVEKQRIPFGGLKPCSPSGSGLDLVHVEKQRIPFGGLKRFWQLSEQCETGLVEKQRIPFGGLKRGQLSKP